MILSMIGAMSFMLFQAGMLFATLNIDKMRRSK
jgi:hypothetical protein